MKLTKKDNDDFQIGDEPKEENYLIQHFSLSLLGIAKLSLALA